MTIININESEYNLSQERRYNRRFKLGLLTSIAGLVISFGSLGYSMQDNKIETFPDNKETQISEENSLDSYIALGGIGLIGLGAIIRGSALNKRKHYRNQLEGAD